MSVAGSTESSESTDSVDRVEDAANTAESSIKRDSSVVSIEIPQTSTDSSTTSSQLHAPDELSEDMTTTKRKKIS